MTSLKHRGKAQRHGGLAVPGRPVEQNRAAGIQRRAAPAPGSQVHLQVADGGLDALHGDGFAGGFLQVYLLGKVFDGDRGGPGVAQPFQRVHGEAPALLRESVPHVDQAAGLARSQGMKQMAIHRHGHELNNHVIRQLDGVNILPRRFQASGVDQLHEQGHELSVFNTCGGDIGGFGRNAVQKAFEGAPVDGADGDQIVAQSAALRGPAGQRCGHVCFRDPLGPDQQITQSHWCSPR